MNSSMICDQKNISSPIEHHHPLLNMFGVIPSALIVTAILLYSMHSLVHRDYPLFAPKPVPAIPEVIADFPEVIEVIPEPLPVKPVEQTPPPSVKMVEPVEVDLDADVFLTDYKVMEKLPIQDMFSASGQMLPIVKVPPQYPQVAITRGIEGYVDVMFDVTPLGTTENIRIIAYVPSTVFNNSVIKAVQRWKYKPNVVDGAPVKTHDVKDRVTFRMQQ